MSFKFDRAWAFLSLPFELLEFFELLQAVKAIDAAAIATTPALAYTLTLPPRSFCTDVRNAALLDTCYAIMTTRAIAVAESICIRCETVPLEEVYHISTIRRPRGPSQNGTRPAGRPADPPRVQLVRSWSTAADPVTCSARAARR